VALGRQPLQTAGQGRAALAAILAITVAWAFRRDARKMAGSAAAQAPTVPDKTA
jgi:hypothetical protein